MVKVGIEAPLHVPVHRQEVYDEILKNNQEALTQTVAKLPQLTAKSHPTSPRPAAAKNKPLMQINADLSADNMAASLLQKRAEPSSGANQPAAARDVASTGRSSDPLLPRLAETPSPIASGDLDVQDGSQAQRSWIL